MYTVNLHNRVPVPKRLNTHMSVMAAGPGKWASCWAPAFFTLCSWTKAGQFLGAGWGGDKALASHWFPPRWKRSPAAESLDGWGGGEHSQSQEERKAEGDNGGRGAGMQAAASSHQQLRHATRASKNNRRGSTKPHVVENGNMEICTSNQSQVN